MLKPVPVLLTFTLLLAAGPRLIGQTPPGTGEPSAAVADTGDPIFRTGTRLVQVDVVVRAEDRPVEGLAQDDFELFDNGRPQQIQVFSLRRAEVVEALPSLPPGIVTNRPLTQGEEPVAATVLLFDGNNLDGEDQSFARQQALAYLERSSPRESIAVLSVGTDLDVLQAFTTDRDLLHSAVNRFKPVMSSTLDIDFGSSGVPVTGDPITDGMTQNALAAARANTRQRRADITTAAFATIARYMNGLPGRKKLIWITASLPIALDEEQSHNGVATQERYNYSAQLEAPMRLLNEANVALYPLDPRGPFDVDLASPSFTTMLRLAELTGGKALYGDNDVAALIDQVMTDTDLTYTLGYYPTEDELDGAFHRLEVRVNRPGADVRYRQGYSAETAPESLDEGDREKILDAWVTEPLDATEIGFTARAMRVSGQPDYRAVEIGIGPLELQFELKDDRWIDSLSVAIVPEVDRKPKGLQQAIDLRFTEPRYLEVLAAGIVIGNSVRVTDDKGKLLSNHLRVVIVDGNSGKAGSVRIPIE